MKYHPIHGEENDVELSFDPNTQEMELMYMPVRARAEFDRMILEYGEVPFKNTVLSFPEINEMKSTVLPFGRVPILKLPNDSIYCESGAIARFGAKLAGIYPTNAEIALATDAVMNIAMSMDRINPILNVYTGEKFEETANEYFKNIPDQLTKIEKIFDSCPGEFFNGDLPLMGDFAMFHRLDQVLFLDRNALKGHKSLGGWFLRMASLTQIKRFLETRPQAKSGEVGLPGSKICTLDELDYSKDYSL